MSERRLLKTAEVAEILGVESQTLRKWRQIGRGPRCVQVGERDVRYDSVDVWAWVEEHKRGSANVRG